MGGKERGKLSKGEAIAVEGVKCGGVGSSSKDCIAGSLGKELWCDRDRSKG